MSNNENSKNNPYYNRIILTPKQQEVLGYLAKGMQNKEIAAEMDLSVSTVKLHVSGILFRLDAKTRTAAVIAAQKSKLIDKDKN